MVMPPPETNFNNLPRGRKAYWKVDRSVEAEWKIIGQSLSQSDDMDCQIPSPFDI